MPISVGDTIPNTTVHVLDDNGMPKPVQTHDVIGKGRTVLFAVPGAFTPGCTNIHLPGYVKNLDALKAKGVDTVACIAVNDPWVLQSWSEANNAQGILMLSDGAGIFAKAIGLDSDASAFGLGVRSRRYSMIIQDGVVEELNLEEGPGISASTCEIVLDHL